MIEEQNIEKPAKNGVESVLSHLLDATSANGIFGQPIERGNTTIIPCSEVMVGMGMGSGGGPTDENGNSQGEGSGGGGGGRARPIAAIVITQDGVHVEPIVDATKVALAAITTGAFVVLWLSRLRRANSGKVPSLAALKRAIDA